MHSSPYSAPDACNKPAAVCSHANASNLLVLLVLLLLLHPDIAHLHGWRFRYEQYIMIQ
jgi:hypothetical protein